MHRILLTCAFLASSTLSLFAAEDNKPLGYTERDFPIHTIASAPEQSKEGLQTALKNFGMVPNLAGVMATSPALMDSYFTLQDNLQKVGSLSPAENNIIQMSIAMENECQYCVAGHTMAGKAYFNSSDAEIQAIRSKTALPQAKQDALRNFAQSVYQSQGRVTDEQLKSFLDAGYNRQQALDVVANISAKVMTNFANQLARTPIDAAFKPLSQGLPFAEDRALKTKK